MRILISSYAFFPSVGGIETLSAALADQFCRRGNEITVITQTPGKDEERPYRIRRCPTSQQLLELVSWCDVFLHNNINVRSAWPLLVRRRPWVVINNGSVQGNALGRVKRFIAHFATASGVSRETAHMIGTNLVIPNCYDDEVFREIPGAKRERDLVYLGRLVTEKGVDVLLNALHRLNAEGIAAELTIVGDGPERQSLERLSSSLHLSNQVIFVGIKRGEELVKELNCHMVAVIPSRYHEAFGIAALEGIACGCVAVGSEDGGLKEAIGPCGLTFPNGDSVALADDLKDLLTGPKKICALRNRAAEHLAHFSKAVVADAYLSVFRRLVHTN